MECIQVLRRDHLAINALLVQIGSEGPCTPEGLRFLAAEWVCHVEHLHATVAEASPLARAEVRDVLDDDERTRLEITERLALMTSGGCTESEIVRLAQELDALLVAHRRAEAAAVALIAPPAGAESIGWVLPAGHRARL